MQLFIRGGSLNVLMVDGDDYVGQVKQQVAVLEGIPVDDQVLSFGGKPLGDSSTLADYGIKESCTLDVLGKVLGGTQ